jgi:hypothetical protein
MNDVHSKFQFRLRSMFEAMLVAALFFGLYRLHAVLALFAGWIGGGALLMYVMARLEFSDIAMSVGFLLILLLETMCSLLALENNFFGR